VFRGAVLTAAGLVVVVLAAMAVFLVTQSLPALRHYGPLSFLGSDRWAPSDATPAGTIPNPYGIVQFIYGTVLTSVIGLLIAVPMSVGIGLFITGIAPAWLRRPLSYMVDLLAAIPSVVFGFWGSSPSSPPSSRSSVS
jgi:phosphate transport system permease protein